MRAETSSDHLPISRQLICDILFSICCLLIIAVSVHDAMLIVLNRAVINQFELNPCGRWLLEIQDGDVQLFVWLKLAGSVVVVTALATLYEIRRPMGLLSSTALAVCQLVLLWYLTCS